MRGLLIKDYYNIKHIKNTYLIIVMVLILYCIFTNKIQFAPIIPILILNTMATSTFTMDNKVKWERLVIPAPIDRKQIVESKFVLGIIMIVFGILIGSVFAIPSLIRGRLSIKTFIEIGLFSVDIALCADSILIGFIFCFSNMIEKIELLTIFAYTISAIITLGLGKVTSLLDSIMGIPLWGASLLNTFLSIIIFYVSYKVSVWIYNEKDFQ